MNNKDYRYNTRTMALKFGAIVLIVVFIVSALLFVAGLFEKKNSEYTGEAPELNETVTHNGQEYVLNKNLETVLVLGLDKFDSDGESDSYNNDKQADFLMLFVIDKEEETYKVIHLNRDAMVEMNILGVAGNKVGTVTKQLALSHTYGNGREVSCRNTANAVSGLLMGADIDHYVSVTMDAVCVYNDFVGGVSLEILDDFTSIDETLVQGETVVLNGEQALLYVRSRYGLDDPTNDHRMKRQKQYLEALYKKTGALAAEDTSFIPRAALAVADYIVSDCSGNKLESLMSLIAEYDVDTIFDIEGETVMGETFLEFYPDENSVKNIVVECFYELKK